MIILYNYYILLTARGFLTVGIWHAAFLSTTRSDIFLVFCGHNGSDQSYIGCVCGLAVHHTDTRHLEWGRAPAFDAYTPLCCIYVKIVEPLLRVIVKAQ